MELDALLEPRSDEAPSGENLEYDEAFVAMEIAANPASDPSGEDPDAQSEPDYGELARAAEAVLERSHDLRAGAFLVLARLKLEGLEGAREAVSYLRGCLDRGRGPAG